MVLYEVLEILSDNALVVNSKNIHQHPSYRIPYGISDMLDKMFFCPYQLWILVQIVVILPLVS